VGVLILGVFFFQIRDRLDSLGFANLERSRDDD